LNPKRLFSGIQKPGPFVEADVVVMRIHNDLVFEKCF